PLRPGQRSRGRSTLRAPAGTRPGRYSVVVCADAAHAVRESAETNNCRGAQRRLVVTVLNAGVGAPSGGSAPAPGPAQGTPPAGSVDSDGDGYPDNLDCAPHDPAVHPGAQDLPDVQFVDSNCDGIDGTAAGAIFVSPIGDDANPGTRTAPKRTFAAAIPAAAAGGKDVYATFGTYTERLDLRNGVSVYGAYSSDWTSRGMGVTRVTGAAEAGSTAGAVAVAISAPTTLQLVTLAPVAPPQPGGSSYGLRGAHSPGLRLEYVTAVAARGVDGAPGRAGSAGIAGGAGADGSAPGGPLGGSSAAGHPGGVGGAHGMADLPDGGPGEPGQSTVPDPWGRMGGPGGNAGAGGSDHGSGGRGGFGDSGAFLGDGNGGGAGGPVPGLGIWQTDDGEDGVGGSNGHGGGGGGGGGADDCLLCSDDGGTGGGGGGGGHGGGAGLGGQGGGGSFGIFLVDSVGARLDHATITASDGGAGGRGGDGAFGGVGGAGGHGSAATGSDASPGGDGGLGGAGGRGGDGGGGAGGPSIAVFGIDAASRTATTVRHGLGGAGGAGGSGAGNGGGRGVSGQAADYSP
ncbi:MAG TPA: hypothetical protein VFH80_31660, partial [Solirubrobacteraceae bacterium]|nr:hypothetical protein [Solirubrobacteraceae bacterium]